MEYKDLKPSENNYNFNIDVLEQVWLEKLKEPFSTKSMFKVLSGAKGFGKTYLICLLAWFFTVNFLDYNVQLAKYTFSAAKDSYYSTMTKVMNDLINYGVTINQAVESKIIKSFNSENRCEWIFDNGRVIRVIGFDNTSKWEGVPATIGEWGMFAIDEVIPVKDTIIDEEAYLYQLFNIIIQIVRGEKLTTSKEVIEELRFNSWQIYKQHLVIFGFNNHDTSHPIYQLFVNSIAPMTNEIKEQLEQYAVSYIEDKQFLNVGATIIRGTTKINENNLNEKLQDFGQGIKERYPEMYQTLFMGGEHELSLDKYSYRKDLIQNAKFFNPQEFFWEKHNRFWFDAIRIGSDYADGGEMGDDAVTILIGYELNNEGYINGIYILEELSISTKKYKSMTAKVNDIANNLVEWSKKYKFGIHQTFLENEMKFRIGQDSRTIKDFIKEILVHKFNFDEEMLDENFTTFKASGNKGWKIASRHYMWKRLLSEQKLYFSTELKVTQLIADTEVVIKKHGHLYDELYKCVNDPKTKMRDEKPKKNKLDAINAAEHALSFFRYSLFK